MQFLSTDISLILEKFSIIVIVVLALLGIALYTAFAERKVAGIMQDRCSLRHLDGDVVDGDFQHLYFVCHILMLCR